MEYGTANLVGSSGENTFATPARLVQTSDGATLYVSDSKNNQVKAVDTASGAVTVIAGTGTPCERLINPFDLCGDNGPAVNATLDEPLGLALSGTETDLYIAGHRSNLVRAVDLTSGTITTFAGSFDSTTGTTFGSGGDGGPSTQAQLAGPTDVAADQSGNVYIADTENNKIRMVNPSGIISTFAGTGSQCADSTGACGDGDAAAAAELTSPRGVTMVETGIAILDGLLIADSEAHKIRRVNSQGIVSTLVGTGTQGSGGDGGLPGNAELNTPTDVSLSGHNALLIADSGNDKIRVAWISPVLNVQTAASAIETLSVPQAVVEDPEGAGIIIADSGNDVVRSFTQPGGTMVFDQCGKQVAAASKASNYMGVLPGTRAIKVQAWGAAGGGVNANTSGGHGGYAQAVVQLNPVALAIFVGCQGHGGSGAGGGGGGATAVTTAQAFISKDDAGILVIAGGGGGGAYDGPGGKGGENGTGGLVITNPVMGNRGHGGKGESSGHAYKGKNGYGGSGGPSTSSFNSPGAGGWGFPWNGSDGKGGKGMGGDEGQSMGGGGGGWGGGGGGWINNEKPYASGGGGSYSVCKDEATTSATSSEDGTVQIEIFASADSATCSP